MRSRGFFVIAFAMTLIGALSVAGQGPQPPVESSFDVSLQLIVGSDDGGRGTNVPGDLSGVTKQIKGSFGFSNYRLASTFLGRISNGGSFEYRSVNNIFGLQSAATHRQTFLEWSLGRFRVVPTQKGQGAQAEAFRFGARVPVFADANNVNYEPIGVTVGRFVLEQDTPTLIGTLSLPGTSGTIFLVMTVRSAD
jgi:hypothetical protein